MCLNIHLSHMYYSLKKASLTAGNLLLECSGVPSRDQQTKNQNTIDTRCAS